MKVHEDSFAYAHKAFQSINDENADSEVQSPWEPNGKINNMNMAIAIVAHPWGHYGQMVVYLRMNQIIPPNESTERQEVDHLEVIRPAIALLRSGTLPAPKPAKHFTRCQGSSPRNCSSGPNLSDSEVASDDPMFVSSCLAKSWTEISLKM